MKKLVISVSGGGALGIGPLQFMKRLEADFGFKLGEKAEAFAGTSTGSIIAAGLCSRMTAADLYDIYIDGLPSIFKEKSGAIPPIARSNYVRYTNTGLKKLLYKYFPGKMDKFDRPIFIPTTFMNGKSVEKVWDRTDTWMDRAYAVMSSCSAPTYFDVLELDGQCYCDGGMWANDPIMVLEAGLKKLVLKQKKYAELFKEGFKILSFNTGMLSENKAPKSKNAVGWLTYIMDNWVARTGNSNYFEACANIGEENVFRCEPVADDTYAMDDLKVVGKVSKLWDAYYDKQKKNLKKWLADL